MRAFLKFKRKRMKLHITYFVRKKNPHSIDICSHTLVKLTMIIGPDLRQNTYFHRKNFDRNAFMASCSVFLASNSRNIDLHSVNFDGSLQCLTPPHRKFQLHIIQVSCVIYFLFFLKYWMPSPPPPTCISIDQNVYYKNAITQIDPFHYVTRVAKRSKKPYRPIHTLSLLCIWNQRFHTACERQKGEKKKLGQIIQLHLEFKVFTCSHNTVHSHNSIYRCIFLRATYCVLFIMTDWREVLVHKLYMQKKKHTHINERKLPDYDAKKTRVNA